MRARCLALPLLLALAVLPAGARAQPSSSRGPFPLVSLPSIGTVTWRCNAAHARYALGFRAFRVSATDHIRFSSGRSVRTATVQPGEGMRFPFAGRVHRLEFVQQTGAGTLRVSVTVRFEKPAVAPYCYAYLPPRVSVTVSPRG